MAHKSSYMSYQRYQGRGIDGDKVMSWRKQRYCLNETNMVQSSVRRREKVDGMKVSWQFGNSVLDTPCTTTVVLFACTQEENHFCLEYLLYFPNVLVTPCLTLSQISPYHFAF